MNSVCYICGFVYHIRPPLDHAGVSHGLCDDCFPAEMERIKKELTDLVQQGPVGSFTHTQLSISTD